MFARPTCVKQFLVLGWVFFSTEKKQIPGRSDAKNKIRTQVEVFFRLSPLALNVKLADGSVTSVPFPQNLNSQKLYNV